MFVPGRFLWTKDDPKERGQWKYGLQINRKRDELIKLFFSFLMCVEVDPR